MNISKNGREIRTLDQWFQFAPPKRGKNHWVEGRSALECARAWCEGSDGPGVPNEIADLLKSHPDTSQATIHFVTPEHQVRFDKLHGEPRNADLAILADQPEGRLAISVEAKADEPFDLCVREVLSALVRKIVADQRTNGVTRIQQLAWSLLANPVPGTKGLGALRYQLLTGIAGALAFAIESNAARAIFIVHEFVTKLTDDAKHKANATDLDAFIARLTAGTITGLSAGKLIGPIQVPGKPLFANPPSLYVGKVVRYLR
jgi:hypothetical protein